MDKKHDDITPETMLEFKNPRISLSMIFMGIGVVASIVFNYAAYGTRITLLENNAERHEKTIEQLNIQLETAIDLLHRIHVSTEADKRDIKYLTDNVARLQLEIHNNNRNKKED